MPSTTSLELPRIIREAQAHRKALQSAKNHPARPRSKRWDAVGTLWRGYDLTTPAGRAWASLQCVRVVWLYGISLAQIHRRSGVAYRTIQYWIHAPDKVGIRSGTLITLAARSLLAERIARLELDEETEFARWNAFDPRTYKKQSLRVRNKPIGSFMRKSVPSDPVSP